MRPVLGPQAARLDRIAVARRISRFRRELGAERLALYRQHLQVTVTRATSLLGIIANDQDVDVRAAMWRLRPGFTWPEGKRSSEWASIAHLLGHRSVRELGGGLGPHDPSRAVLVRDRNHPLGPLILRVVGGSLEITVAIGDVIIRTGDGSAQLTLQFDLPATIELAVVGRPIGCLVGHPWFTDERWTVGGVRRRPRGGTVVSFATGDVPFSMPWQRLVREGQAA